MLGFIAIDHPDAEIGERALSGTRTSRRRMALAYGQDFYPCGIDTFWPSPALMRAT